MDQLAAMRVFVDVVDLGSLSAAANKLDMSRSMASRYIAALEKSLGTRLLHRSSRSLGLTSTGNDILPYCRQMLSLAVDIQALVASQHAEPCGVVRVATSVSFGQSYLAAALERFLALNPRISVELVLADRPINLVEERIDLAIQVGEVQESGLISRLLTQCSSVVCAAPAYLANFGMPETPKALAHHNCLIHTRHGKIWRFGSPDAEQGRWAMTEIPVYGNFSANDTLVLLNAVLAGRGIACLPQFSVSSHLRDGRLIALFSDFKLPELGVYALLSSRKHMPLAIRALLDFLVVDIEA
jgi:DNA-binding transcriptional LysR family regulator